MGLIQDLFFKGEYSQVLAKTFDQNLSVSADVLEYVVGSLCFSGRIQECAAFCKARYKKASELQVAYFYFFMAISYVRRSQYKKAKKLLKVLNRLAVNHLEPEIKFLNEQGLAFYLHFLGRFETSLRRSEGALQFSVAAENLWMRALAHDLLANNLVLTGSVHEGLKHLERAKNISIQIENKALKNAIEVSQVIYSCEYGIDLKSSYSKLVAMYGSFLHTDNFSAANLGLEYARQQTLRGEWTGAAQRLNEISRFIFQNKNRRQEARFYLRWAELQFLKNDLMAAHMSVRAGQRCLEMVDHTYEMQLLGMEKKIYLAQNAQVPRELTVKLNELSLRYSNIKNLNILSREGEIYDRYSAGANDDEIHRMLEAAGRSAKQAREVIFSTGYLSWVYRFYDLKRGEKYVLLNLENKKITLISSDGIFHKPNQLSSLHFKILSKISQGMTSKEDLLKEVWGYQYEPLRHDSLIYSTLSNLRKVFEEDSLLIETTEVGYKLRANLMNFLHKETKSAQPQVNDATIRITTDGPQAELFVEQNINARQIQILQYLKSHQFISVKTVMGLFSTSEITANRDLRALFLKKLVIRVGQGRATQYTRIVDGAKQASENKEQL